MVREAAGGIWSTLPQMKLEGTDAEKQKEERAVAEKEEEKEEEKALPPAKIRLKLLRHFMKDICEDLVKSLGSKLWRVRQSSAAALADALQLGDLEVLASFLPTVSNPDIFMFLFLSHSLLCSPIYLFFLRCRTTYVCVLVSLLLAQFWYMILRALDDVKETVRQQAEITAKRLRGFTVRLVSEYNKLPEPSRQSQSVGDSTYLPEGFFDRVILYLLLWFVCLFVCFQVMYTRSYAGSLFPLFVFHRAICYHFSQ